MDDRKVGCHYCETKAVIEVNDLPCKCPVCGMPLLKLWDNMTQEEKLQAELRKAVLKTEAPTYTLAG